jgi:hypothetical protein
MENFYLQANVSAHREPNFAPLVALIIIEPKSSNFAFDSLVIPHLHANLVCPPFVRRRFPARDLVGRSGY